MNNKIRNCRTYISNTPLNEIWPAGMTLAQAEEALHRKAEANGVVLSGDVADAILDVLNKEVQEGLRYLTLEQLTTLQYFFPETAALLDQPAPRRS